MKISRRNFLAVAGAAACSDRLRRFFRFLYQHCFFRSCQLCRRFRRSRRR